MKLKYKTGLFENVTLYSDGNEEDFVTETYYLIYEKDPFSLTTSYGEDITHLWTLPKVIEAIDEGSWVEMTDE